MSIDLAPTTGALAEKTWSNSDKLVAAAIAHAGAKAVIDNTVGQSTSDVSATATITGILNTSGIPAALDAQTITIIDGVGTSKIYKFFNGGGKATGATDSGNIVVQISGETTAAGLVDNLEQAIEHANGHNGTITVSRSDKVLTLTQADKGSSGNTAITFSAGINTTTEMSKTDFTGGSVLDYTPDTQAERLALVIAYKTYLKKKK